MDEFEKFKAALMEAASISDQNKRLYLVEDILAANVMVTSKKVIIDKNQIEQSPLDLDDVRQMEDKRMFLDIAAYWYDEGLVEVGVASGSDEDLKDSKYECRELKIYHIKS